MHDIYYLVYLTLPGIGTMLYSLRAYISSRREPAWTGEFGVIWSYGRALVPSTRPVLVKLVVTNVLFGFVMLAIAWEMIVNPSHWLNLLVGFLIFAGMDGGFSYLLIRGYQAFRRSLATDIASLQLYSDRLRIMTGTRDVLDIPLSEAVICIASLGWHDVYGNRLDTLRIRYAGTTYTFTVPGGVGQEFINALRSVGIDEIHTCNYLGIK